MLNSKGGFEKQKTEHSTVNLKKSRLRLCGAHIDATFTVL